MKCGALSRRLLASASILAMATGFSAAPTAPAVADSYMAGDFHNHTTCTDGTVSIETMVRKSIQTFGLEWLASADHGGSGARDCRVNDPELNGSNTGTGKFWDEARDGFPAEVAQGDVINSGGHRAMWRWQIIEQFVFPEIARLSPLPGLQRPMLYAGLETNAPGHEHVSMSIIGAQKPEAWGGNQGNASALAEWEFRFDRSDTDAAGKGGTPGPMPGTGIPGLWTGKVANASGANSGITNHNKKARPSVQWLQANFPLDSYYVPAHVERAGVFDPNGNRGFNVEHFRDFNNDGPTVAVGFETMPGHQASNTRGEYQVNFCGPGCHSVGITTYGGTGIYGAQIGGMWDALLGEGRNWFFYASSDWHNRGLFSPFEVGSTNDFYPGEYQKLYIPRPSAGVPLRPQVVVDAVRAGNSFSLSGDLITGELTYTAEVVGMAGVKARMGQTLVVPRGRTVRIILEVNLPTTPNHSPYAFNNPSLAQIGIQEPLNRPTLRNVNFIRGNVTGVVSPGSPNYTNGTNPSAQIAATFNSSNWTVSGQKRTMVFHIPNVQGNQYVRARGTNLPPATPFETDAQGNPLTDPAMPEASMSGAPTSVAFVPCTDPACPSHMARTNGAKISSYDVAAWADLWFYTNPIFIRVHDQPKLLVETNADRAASLRR
jgi:hypothetical protein